MNARRARVTLAAVVTTVAASTASAQSMRPSLDVVAGAGAIAPHAAPGLARNDGLFALVALEARPNGGRFGLRAEARIAQQSLDFPAGGGVLGDAVTPSAALLARFELRRAEHGAATFVPYLLGGLSVARPSTRFAVVSTDPNVPGASYEQTSSEVATGVLAGAGLRARIARGSTFAELRYERLATDHAATTTSPLLVGVLMPIAR